jgi:putative ABC transport system permease protein
VALGIGATTAMFSVAYGVLFRPLPYPDASRLVLIGIERQFAGRWEPSNFSAVELPEWQSATQAFEDVAAYADAEVALETETGRQMLGAECVSPNFFRAVGLAMLHGRWLGADDEDSRAVVISSRLWAHVFGSSREIVGRTIRLSGDSYVVVGVAPPEFRVPDESNDVWLPMRVARTKGIAPWLANPRGGGMHLMARLRRGVTLEQAQADVDATGRRLGTAFGYSSERARLTVAGLIDILAAHVRPALLMLLAAVGLVLLIACANLMNLLLARQSARSQEIAVRIALGASQARLFVHTMAEATVVGMAGGAVGVAMAFVGVKLLVWLEPPHLPRLDAIHVDGPVLAFTAATAALAAVLAGLWPAIGASRRRATGDLYSRAATHAGVGERTRAALVVGEMALSIVLLVGAALLARSFAQLLHTDVGARTDHTLAVRLDLTLGRQVSDAVRSSRAEALVSGVQAIPGVELAALGAAVPPSRELVRYTLKDQPAPNGVLKELEIDAVPVTTDFFRALGVPLLKGRLFGGMDMAGRPAVMIMSAATASLLFGDDPLGGTLTLPTPQGENVVTTLIGVVGNVRYRGLARPAPNVIYLPFAQRPWYDAYLLARTSGDPLALTPAIRHVIGRVDPKIGIAAVSTLDEIMSDQVAQPRFRTVVLMGLAMLASVLAAIGLYGVVAFAASRRTREIGIRTALGAAPQGIVWLMLR